VRLPLGLFLFQVADNGNPAKAGAAIFTVNIVDLNEQPRFVSGFPTSLSLAENVPRGTWLANFPAVDPDIADVNRLVFSWVNPLLDANGVPVFALDRSNGSLTVNGDVNFEVRVWLCVSIVCLKLLEQEVIRGLVV
jgi:hypothetical protein